MSSPNLRDGLYVTGGLGKIEINKVIAYFVKEHLGTEAREGLCLALVGPGKKNFQRHIHEHTVDFSCNIHNLVYVDYMTKVVRELNRYKKQLYPTSGIRIVQNNIVNELDQLVSSGAQISVLDHDGVLPFSETEVEALRLGAEASCEIMIVTVPSRTRKLSRFLDEGWDRYNGCEEECNLHRHQGYDGEEWRPRVCVFPHHSYHRMGIPSRNIQAFMMKEEADSLGYRFIALPYKGGTEENTDGVGGSPMMVGLFLKN